MAALAELSSVLGGPAVIGRVRTLDELRLAVKAGLPVSALRAVQDTLELTGEDASKLLAMPTRTMARRNKQERLPAEESDRLVRFARVTAHAINVFQDRGKASHWMRIPNRALGGAEPLSLLDGDIGTEQVHEILGRIEYGIYS